MGSDQSSPWAKGLDVGSEGGEGLGPVSLGVR